MMSSVFPPSVLHYGSRLPLPDRLSLRAGPLSLDFEEGGLRRVRLGDREILRRVHVAVRDRDWATAPASLSDVRVERGADSFRIAFAAEHRQGPIHFVWRGRIEGDPRGTIRFTMDGEARSTFQRNRIGFCVLHPVRECSGQPCAVENVDGSIQEGTFPRLISPHQPFKEIRAISHEVVPGLRAEVRLEGETFEMEDQRNWTDASYKTYGTPLELPFPVEVRAGTKIAQAVTLSLRGDAPAAPASAREEGIAVAIGDRPCGPLPRIGLGVAGHGRPLTPKELTRLRALNLAHLRVDLKLSLPDHVSALERASAEARALGVPLEAALFLSDAAAGELKALRATLDRVRAPVGAWLIFHHAEACMLERPAALARERLASYDPSARFGGGTNAYFTELNRGRPAARGQDFVCWSMNPQVHAFDNGSLVENLEGQAAVIESARRLYEGLPLVVSPITLRPRFNPHRGWPEPDPPPGELPFSVDVRQMSLFGAAWTVGSLQAMAEGGAAAVTYYETVGRRGVMEAEEGSPVPEKFPSLPGAVFPLYHVLADAGEFAGGEALPVATSDPSAVRALAMRKEGRTRLLVANLGAEVRTARVSGLPGTAARVRLLDETNAEEAMREPEAYRARAGEPAEARGGLLEIPLRPFAVARLDAG